MEGPHTLISTLRLSITVGLILLAGCQASSYVSRLASGPLVLTRFGDSGNDGDDTAVKSAVVEDKVTPPVSSFALSDSSFSDFGKPPSKLPSMDEYYDKNYPKKPHFQWYPKNTEKTDYDHRGYDEYW